MPAGDEGGWQVVEGSDITHRGQPSTHDTGTAVGSDEVAQSMSDLARLLEAEDDPDQLLAEVVSAAINLIPGVDEGSISVVIGRRNVHSQHPSGDLPKLVDAVQTETGEGPCLQAVYEHQTVRVPDMASEERWPNFARRAAELGAASMLSFQLYVEGDNLGALNLYGRRPNAFDDESEHIGLLFASHAAIAFAGSEKARQLHRAVARRDVIGQAKGILMERYNISADQAFAALLRLSQHQNRKLFDLAEELGNTRTLPNLPRLSGS